jgi:glycosyltransferase involved in cell wall biosynthesis
VHPILFLAYHFPPIGGGGVQRNVKFVRYLSEFGYQSIVITGPGGAKNRWTPEDVTLAAEVPASSQTRRLPGPEPESRDGWRGRAERSLMLKPPFVPWWNDGVFSVAKELDAAVDLIYCSLVPYESGEAAARLARNLGKPWVADLQDPWALDEMWIYPTGLHRRRDLARMRRLLVSADAVVMNTPEAARRVLAQFPELREKLVVSIPNGFDRADFDPTAPARDDSRFRIVHSGYLHTDVGRRLRRTSRARRILGGTAFPVDILTRSHVFLLEAIDQLIAHEPSLRTTIEVHLAGVLTAEDQEVAARSSVVRMPGYLSHADTLALVRSADLLFLPMQDLPVGTRAGLVPGKTYEYLASGRPILAAVPDGDARDLLTEAGSALLCRPADSNAMATLIAGELERWRANLAPPPPDPEVLRRYERRELTRQLAQVFDAVLGTRRQRLHSVMTSPGS